MKKFKLVLLSVVLGLVLCACGEKETTSFSDLEASVLMQQYGAEDINIQTWRSYRAATIANSYVVETIDAIIDDPSILGAPFDTFTYPEVETHVYQASGFLTDGYAFANAVDNFKKGYVETGRIVTREEPIVYVDGDEIIVDIACACENRNADIEMIFVNDLSEMKLTSAAFNPRYTTGEKMNKAGLNTVIGMGTVFVMLIAIAIIINLLGPVTRFIEKVSKAVKAFFHNLFHPEDKAEEGINKAVEQIVKNETAESSDAELVAVIAAAVAAYEGTTDTSGFVVRSIRKIKRQ